MKDKYFIHLVPLDQESQNILKEKEYKSDKSIVDMWYESIK